MTTQADQLPEHPLHGIYDVQSFRLNGESLPPLATDPRRWRRVIIDPRGLAWVTAMDESRFWLTCNEPTTCSSGPGNDSAIALSYDRPAEGRLDLSGKIAGEDVVVQMKKRDLKAIPLLGSEFRWMSQ